MSRCLPRSPRTGLGGRQLTRRMGAHGRFHPVENLSIAAGAAKLQWHTVSGRPTRVAGDSGDNDQRWPMRRAVLSMSLRRKFVKPRVEPGFFRTDLLTPESTSYAKPSIDDYADRTKQTVTVWNGMNGLQGEDPAKLATALMSRR
jgi:hypothetical protein